jgi:hypothetical protein
MDANEIIIWAILWFLVSIEVAGLGYMICSRQEPIYETDLNVVEADLAELRAASRR